MVIMMKMMMMTWVEEENGVTIEENNLNQDLGSIKTTRLINISNIVKDNAPTYIVTKYLQFNTIVYCIVA
jgi:hypothetical protein